MKHLTTVRKSIEGITRVNKANLPALVSAYANAHKAYKEAEAIKKEVQGLLEGYLAKLTTLPKALETDDGDKVTVVSAKPALVKPKFNEARFAAEHADLYAQYLEDTEVRKAQPATIKAAS